jgi:hypothetical protein
VKERTKEVWMRGLDTAVTIKSVSVSAARLPYVNCLSSSIATENTTPLCTDILLTA